MLARWDLVQWRLESLLGSSHGIMQDIIDITVQLTHDCFASGWDVKYCNEYVSVSLCLSVYLSQKPHIQTLWIFCTLSGAVAWFSSADMEYIMSFRLCWLIIFSRNGAYRRSEISETGKVWFHKWRLHVRAADDVVWSGSPGGGTNQRCHWLMAWVCSIKAGGKVSMTALL